MEANIFALQGLNFGNDTPFYLHHFSSHCVSGIVGDFELPTKVVALAFGLTQEP